MEWLIGGVGGLHAAMAIALSVLHFLVERQKAAAERNRSDALWRAWRDAGHVGEGGFLMVVLAIFIADAGTGFRVLIVPLGAPRSAVALSTASWTLVRGTRGG